jgi:hypothetical protein
MAGRFGCRRAIYVATAVPVPWGRRQRGHDGDALYTNSTLALDPKTGRILWHHQHIPGDNWDMDHAFERHVVRSEVRPNQNVRWVNREAVGDGRSQISSSASSVSPASSRRSMRRRAAFSGPGDDLPERPRHRPQHRSRDAQSRSHQGRRRDGARLPVPFWRPELARRRLLA